MLCSALAKWALDQGYLVIYVSSAYKHPNDPYGSTFGKIETCVAGRGIFCSSDHDFAGRTGCLLARRRKSAGSERA